MSKIKRAIISIFEPHIQAMITERLIMFRGKLENDDIIPRLRPRHSSQACIVSQGPPSPLAAPLDPALQHECKAG